VTGAPAAMTTLSDELRAAPLGHATGYPDTYDAALLFPVPRAPQREEIGIVGALPFDGADVWTAFELTWLDPHGKPAVVIASFEVPATSPAIVESKSVKLYLGSFAQSRFADASAVSAAVVRDLSAAVGAPVRLNWSRPPRSTGCTSPNCRASASTMRRSRRTATRSIPRCSPPPGRPPPRPCAPTSSARCARSRGSPTTRRLPSRTAGPRTTARALLRYLVSYRTHPGFHEHCVERILRRRGPPPAVARR